MNKNIELRKEYGTNVILVCVLAQQCGKYDYKIIQKDVIL